MVYGTRRVTRLTMDNVDVHVLAIPGKGKVLVGVDLRSEATAVLDAVDLHAVPGCSLLWGPCRSGPRGVAACAACGKR